MDLAYVIGELRSELASLDEVISSLEKLAEIRRRRVASEEAEAAGMPAKSGKTLRRAAGSERDS